MKLDATQNLLNGSSPVRFHGLPPAAADKTRMLILGSFPGATSLARQQYYAHPQNAFWKIFQAIWPSSPDELSADSYEKRINGLLDKGIGLWDVYASCEREGSLDGAIQLPQVNDLAKQRHHCPNLRLIAHNGQRRHLTLAREATLHLPKPR
jgi:hypoxanthine-DNA glycosylase